MNRWRKRGGNAGHLSLALAAAISFCAHAAAAAVAILWAAGSDSTVERAPPRAIVVEVVAIGGARLPAPAAADSRQPNGASHPDRPEHAEVGLGPATTDAHRPHPLNAATQPTEPEATPATPTAASAMVPPASPRARPSELAIQAPPPAQNATINPAATAASVPATGAPATESGSSGETPVSDRDDLGAPAGAASNPGVADGNPAPAYPKLARRRGWEGVVLLRVDVSAEGSGRTVLIERSSGYDVLDDAALGTVSDWRFVPAIEAGRPVAASLLLPIEFRLDD